MDGAWKIAVSGVVTTPPSACRGKARLSGALQRASLVPGRVGVARFLQNITLNWTAAEGECAHCRRREQGCERGREEEARGPHASVRPVRSSSWAATVLGKRVSHRKRGRAPPENKYAQESGVKTEKLERVPIKLFETPRFVHRGLSGNEISSATGGQAFSGKGQRVSVFSFAVGKETHVAPSEKRKGSSESRSFARRCVVFPGKGFHGWIVSLVKCGRVFLGLLVFKCPGGF